MKTIFKITFIICIVTNLVGCKNEILLDNYTFDDIMVVDGKITNEKGPYKILISKSSPLNSNKKVPYEDCVITLYDGENRSEALTENMPGVYFSSKDGIQGEIGKSYYITIITPDGKTYKTEPQQILEPLEIDTIYAELVYKYLGEYNDGTTPGYQFYTSTKLANINECYLLWNIDEIYTYSTDYDLYAIDDKGIFKYVGQDTSDIFQEVKWCWKTQSVGFLSVAETGSLDKPQITNHPLHFVGTNSRKLKEKYCLFLKQYSINKEAYVYWKNIKDQISSDNILMLSQPFDVKGNVKNINDPYENVYGYFTVASVSQKRVFFNKPEASFEFDKCVVIVPIPPARPLSDYYVKTEDGTVGSVEKECLDCRSYGGDIIKPEFWIEY